MFGDNTLPHEGAVRQRQRALTSAKGRKTRPAKDPTAESGLVQQLFIWFPDKSASCAICQIIPSPDAGKEYGPEEVWAGGAFAYGDQIIYGDLVQTDIAGFWGEGVFWTDFLLQPEGVFWTDFFTEGVFWTDSLIVSDGTETDIATGDGD